MSEVVEKIAPQTEMKVNVRVKDLSQNDRRMLNSIYWRSFTEYCFWAG